MARRARRRGFGALRTLPSGRIQASYIGPDTLRHVAPVTFTHAIDAEAWLASEHRLMERDDWTPPAARAEAERVRAERDALTLDDFARRLWLPTLDLRPSTARDYDSLLRNHISPRFGSTPLVAITKGDVRAWWASMDATKPRARAKAFQLLHNIMGGALDLELVSANPVTLPKRTKNRTGKNGPEVVPLTVDQLNVLADAMPPRLRMAVLLGCWCSLRYGELSELRRSDFYLDDDKVPAQMRGKVRAPVAHVSRGVVKVKGGYLPGEPKTPASVRWVHIPPTLLPDLRAHIKDHAAWGRDGLVFPATNGGHMHSTTFARAFAKAAAAAGRPDATPHVLRHTGVSLTAKAGATTRENMARAGHSTPGMSLHYTHAMDGEDARLADRLSVMLAESREAAK